MHTVPRVPALSAQLQTFHHVFDFRAALMVRNGEGLTRTYNRFHDPDETDPDVTELRTLHTVMDRAVLAAYDWSDIAPDYEFLLDYAIDEEEWGRKKSPGAIAGPTPPATKSSPASSP